MIQTVTKTYTNLDGSLWHYIQAFVDGDLLDIIAIDESDGRISGIKSLIKSTN